MPTPPRGCTILPARCPKPICANGNRATPRPADFAVVWRPPREMLAGRDDLRAIFNLGAGVDAILALEREHPGTLPRNAQLVRLEDTGMAPQMAEYVTHAVLRYLRRFDEYQTLQAQRRWKVLEPHPRETFTVGVLGLGVLGAHVAQTLAAFGMPVRGYSRSARQIDGVTTFAGEAQFDAFLDGVKVLVNLLPHTPDTARRAERAHVREARARRVSDQRRARRPSGRTGSARRARRAARSPPPRSTCSAKNRCRPIICSGRNRASRSRRTCSAQTLREESVAQVAQKIAALMRGETVSGVVNIERGY